MKYKKLGALLLTGALALSLGACSKSDDKDGDKDAGSNANGAITYPITFDSCGTKVTIEKEPKNVLSIGVASGIFAANAAKKGQYTTRAGELGEKNPLADEFGAKLWTDGEPGTEEIIEKGVDLVIADLYGKRDPQKLADAGIPIIIPSVLCHHAKSENPELVSKTVEPSNLTAAATDIRELGKVLNNTDAAEKAAKDYESRIEKAKADAPKDNKSAAFVFYFSKEYPIMSVGEGGVEGALMQAVGLKNIFADEKEAYIEEVNWESILKADPDVIIIKYGRTGSTFEEDKARFLKEPGAENLKAVKNNHIIGISNRQTWPSPGIAEGLETLVKDLKALQ